MRVLSFTVFFILFSKAAFAINKGDRVIVDTPDGSHHRARVLEMSGPDGQVQVEMMSTGKTESVSIQEIRLDPNGTLEALNATIELQKRVVGQRKQELERRKRELDQRTEILNTCSKLTCIPRILDGFCTPECSQTMQEMSDYVSCFTGCFIDSQLKQNNPESLLGHEGMCSLCMSSIDQDEASLTLGCKHGYHLECLRLGLKSYLDQERINAIKSCQHSHCDYQFTPEELATLVSSPEEALQVQRAFVRSEPVLKFCPRCGEGIAKHNSGLSFAYHCQKCDRDLCFSCGREPHHDFTCEELYTDDGVKRAFIQEIIKNGEQSSYGLCPNCQSLIAKLDGCDSMVCGQNADDKKQIQGSVQGRGCGHRFDWRQRVPVENALKNDNDQRANDMSVSSSPVAGYAPILPRVVPALAQDLNALRAQRGITRIAADDPRVAGFPEFVALGEMWLVGDLLLSGVAPQAMNYANAKQFCRNLDGNRNWLGMRGATAPTSRQWRRIRQAMGEGTPARYDADLIPDIINRWFWSSSPDTTNSASAFYGQNGYIVPAHRNVGNFVRCVRRAAW